MADACTTCSQALDVLRASYLDRRNAHFNRPLCPRNLSSGVSEIAKIDSLYTRFLTLVLLAFCGKRRRNFAKRQGMIDGKHRLND